MGRIFNVACHRRKDHDGDYEDNGDKSLYNCGDISFPDPEVSDPIGSNGREGGGGGRPPPSSNKRLRIDDGEGGSGNKGEEGAGARTSARDDGVPVVNFVTGNAKKLEELRRIILTYSTSASVNDGDKNDGDAPTPSLLVNRPQDRST